MCSEHIGRFTSTLFVFLPNICIVLCLTLLCTRLFVIMHTTRHTIACGCFCWCCSCVIDAFRVGSGLISCTLLHGCTLLRSS